MEHVFFVYSYDMANSDFHGPFANQQDAVAYAKEVDFPNAYVVTLPAMCVKSE